MSRLYIKIGVHKYEFLPGDVLHAKSDISFITFTLVDYSKGTVTYKVGNSPLDTPMSENMFQKLIDNYYLKYIKASGYEPRVIPKKHVDAFMAEFNQKVQMAHRAVKTMEHYKSSVNNTGVTNEKYI